MHKTEIKCKLSGGTNEHFSCYWLNEPDLGQMLFQVGIVPPTGYALDY